MDTYIPPPTARLVLMVTATAAEPLSYTRLANLTRASAGTLGKVIPRLVRRALLVRTTVKGMSYFSSPFSAGETGTPALERESHVS